MPANARSLVAQSAGDVPDAERRADREDEHADADPVLDPRWDRHEAEEERADRRQGHAGDRDRPDQGEQRHYRKEKLLVLRDLAKKDERCPAEGKTEQPPELAADEGEERSDR